jgi:hypothetical protein
MWIVNRALAKVMRRIESLNPTWRYAGIRDKIVAQTSEGVSFYIDIRKGADTWYITKHGNPLVAEVVVKQGDVTIYQQTFVNMPVSRELRKQEPYRAWIVSDSAVNYVVKYHSERVSEMLRRIENVKEHKDSCRADAQPTTTETVKAKQRFFGN